MDRDFPLASHIDQTILRPTATAEEIEAVARRAAGLGFAALCLPPWAVARAASIMSGAPTRVQTVVGFPLGIQTTQVKAFEAREAVQCGAQEVDMVVNRAWLRDGWPGRVEEEIKVVVRAAAPAEVKTILEISDLSPGEIRAALDRPRRIRRADREGA